MDHQTINMSTSTSTYSDLTSHHWTVLTMALPSSNCPPNRAPQIIPHDPLHQLVVGYPKLAAKMELQPELAIYRRFGALNGQNLLYYQAELMDLEQQLRKQQAEDGKNLHGKKSEYGKDWYRLQDSSEDGDTEQLDLVLKIRKLLNEYSGSNVAT
jgi:hypothetical protein